MVQAPQSPAHEQESVQHIKAKGELVTSRRRSIVLIECTAAARTSPLSKFSPGSPNSKLAYSSSPSSLVLDAPLTEKHFASTPLKQQNEYWSSDDPASSSAFGSQSFSSDASSPIVTPQSVKAKRRSSHGFPAGSCSPHPPSPLVGSYENSLLSGRMSEAPSKPLPYIAQVGVMSSTIPQAGPSNIKGKNKAPKFGNQLSLGFDAFFYPQSGPVLPYVGNIDLEEHYFDQLSDMSESTPRFPGYRIPAKGQIQLVIKNPNKTAVKLFLVPYDLTSLPAGSKTFLQQKSYALPTTPVPSPQPARRLSSNLLESPDIFNKGSLRYAVRLQFCSAPIKKDEKQRYYLHKSIRVVFAFRSPDSHEKLRVSFDGPALEEGWSEYDGPGEEWVSARRARAKREKRIKMVDSQPTWGRWKSPVVSDEEERRPVSVRGFDIEPSTPSRLGRESAEGMFTRTGSPVGWSERTLAQAVSGSSSSGQVLQVAHSA